MDERMIPYFSHEGDMARMERTNRRLFVIIIILIAALLGTNAGWIYYESQFEVQETKIATEVLEEAEQNEGWIPIKYRPMTEEEKEAFFETYGTEADPAEIFDCPMPEDEEEILLTIQIDGRSYTDHDTVLIDCNLYWLEDRGDWDNVTAWRPVPKPYGGPDEEK